MNVERLLSVERLGSVKRQSAVSVKRAGALRSPRSTLRTLHDPK